MFREGVLLKELFLDNARSSEHCLLLFSERVLSDQLDNLLQFVFCLENLPDGLSQGHELGVLLGVVLGQGSVVVREGDVPVNGGEMFPLGQLLVQTPEDRHN